MSDFVKCAWYFFLAFLFFGLWTFPILIGIYLSIALVRKLKH